MSFFETHTWNGRMFSGGWRAGDGGVADVIAPATGETLAQYGVATPADLDRAVAEASQAQRAWSAMPFAARAAIFRRAGQLVEEHTPEFISWLAREAGSGVGKAGFEAHLVASEFYSAAAAVEQPYGQLLRSNKPRLSFSRRVPVGVVGIISPFNFPGILSARSLAPALAAGNGVILKPDPRTAVSGGLFLAAIVEAAGFPEGLVHVLPGGADIGAALVDHAGVPVISFTGSTAAGRAVGAAGALKLKRIHLELGGNNALIVLDDVDVEAAASAGAWGSFLHQGQICMTTGRHIVHESVYEEYVRLLSEKARHIPVGDTGASDVPLGPIIDERQRDKVHALVEGSRAAGATISAGGSYDGLFYQPTVISDSQPDHPAFTEEVFGPVAPVIKFSTIEEAISIARMSDYGLSLGILTRNVMRGLEIADQIPSGIVHINDQTVDDESVAPFGGVGASGTGARFGGAEANLDAFTETQWVTVQGEIERYPF